MGRLQNSLFNALTASGCRILELFFSIISRIIIIQVLGVEYLGISGLFANILSLFSIAEMGFSYALVQVMYKPMAESDASKLASIVRYFRKIYLRVIGVIILMGMVFLPFIPHVIKDVGEIENITIIYLIFLANFIAPYFVADKKSLVIVAQKEYLLNIYGSGIKLVQIILQLVVLYHTHNYILFIGVMLLATLINNGVIVAKSNKMLNPAIRAPKLDRDTKATIKDNAKALFINNVSGIVFSGTDNIIISKFLGLVWTGIYTNYTSIIFAIRGFLLNGFSSISSSWGNYMSCKGIENQMIMYKRLLFLTHFVIILFGIDLLCLFNDFINLAYGKEYEASMVVVALVIMDFCISIFRYPTLITRNVLGIFRYDRYKGIFECAINLGLSLALVGKWGLSGVMIGTVLGTGLVSLWIEPLMLYRHGFKKKAKEFWKFQAPYLLFFLFGMAGCLLFAQCISVNGWLLLIAKGIGVSILIAGSFLLAFRRTEEFQYYVSLLHKRPR